MIGDDEQLIGTHCAKSIHNIHTYAPVSLVRRAVIL